MQATFSIIRSSIWGIAIYLGVSKIVLVYIWGFGKNTPQVRWKKIIVDFMENTKLITNLFLTK